MGVPAQAPAPHGPAGRKGPIPGATGCPFAVTPQDVVGLCYEDTLLASLPRGSACSEDGQEERAGEVGSPALEFCCGTVEKLPSTKNQID